MIIHRTIQKRLLQIQGNYVMKVERNKQMSMGKTADEVIDCMTLSVHNKKVLL